MPTAASITFNATKLTPAYQPELAIELPANFPASVHYAAGTVLGEVAASPGTYKAYSGSNVTAPVAGPTLAEGAAGALAAGDYWVSFSYVNANGQTTVSPAVKVTIGASKQIAVTAITPLPAGVVSVNWFMSEAVNGTDLKFIANNNGAAFSINAMPAAGAADEPLANTALAGSDGSQIARAILVYEITTDAGGNITLGAQAGSEFGETVKSAPVYVSGFFFTADLTGLDAAAIASMNGALVQGTTTTGVFKF